MLIKTVTVVLLSFSSITCANTKPDLVKADSVSAYLGRFSDDYNSTYEISTSAWIHDETYTYHILEWNADSSFVIARNDRLNPADQNLYTRIDYVLIESPPYTWAFCLSAYSATTSDAAKLAVADKSNPRDGCNGFPFTRMQRVQ